METRLLFFALFHSKERTSFSTLVYSTLAIPFQQTNYITLIKGSYAITNCDALTLQNKTIKYPQKRNSCRLIHIK